MGSAIAPYRSSLPASAPARGLASYLTSRRNLTGSALALVGAGLALADPVGIQGLLLVAGLYLAGALAAGGKPRFSRFGFDPQRVQKSLVEQIGAAAGRVPPHILSRMPRSELTTRPELPPRPRCFPPAAPGLCLLPVTVASQCPTAADAPR